ncbi:ATP-dependent DNA helicase DinG [Lederbergia citrea]|uniref:3'-5' exonuclease DinG n=1 Tax=Lederbergia citrea TaxID=2833581 RepID=A0A942Z262_9BACI|nr:ATP-dependent DNA helicase DinG [Lederbergia citrea]MBS4222178.1 ATP-dependent DNA helicase DinG [Lederbergia citrea]
MSGFRRWLALALRFSYKGVDDVSRKYVVVDLETTGNTHDRGDKIIQISAVVVENLKIISQYTTFVNPGVPIPPFIEELTGIHDGMVATAPAFKDIAVDINELLIDSIFVAHNVPFDLGFLQGELNEAGFHNFSFESVDTVELSKILLPEAPSYKLSELSEMLGFDHENPHQADSDALVTAELLLMLIEKARKLPLVTLEKLTHMAFQLKSDIGSLFQSILTDKRKSIENLPDDLEVYRGIAMKKKIIPEAKSYELHVDYPSNTDEKIGLLTGKMNGYKPRQGQIEMMDTVYAALNEDKHAVIEAGTGIGKSLAYLLPSLYFAFEHKQPVIISTYTIQMQDQLLNNEMERLSKIVPFPFRATILKGRSNYLNMLKFEQSLNDNEGHYDSVLTKMQLLVWLVFTDTGDMDELNFSSGGHVYKQRIKHDGWFFQQEKDPWYSRDFYMHARKLASNADIVITNHSMLLIDTETEVNVLPEYQYVIIDEAHHFERAARKCFGKKIEYNSLKFWIGRLGTLDKKLLFSRLEKMIESKGLSPSIHSFELDKAIIHLDEEIDDLFMLLSKIVSKNHRKKSQKSLKQQIRITENTRSESKWNPLAMCAERVFDYHRQICKGLEERLTSIKQHEKKPTESEQAFLEEANSFVKGWLQIGEKIKQLILSPSDQEVIWLEGDVRALPNSIGIFSQPKSPGDLLAESFFANKNSVVFTSATLTVNNSFNFFLSELGLKRDQLLEKIIASPFDYRKIAKLMIPSDLPEIRGASHDEYIEAIAGHLIAIADATEGRMLVLFTSYDMLSKTYNLMKDTGALDDFVMLAQGITAGSRSRLTKSFQQFNKAILFGTSSFWEGVDIPGKDLSCLVIVRLPFSPPDEPITEAIYEDIKKSGKNPFSVHSLPEAVIRFKQGFGRLIRGETDRGVVIVLDRRIDTATYGRAFLRSIPDVPVVRGPLKEIISTIEKWL